MSCKERSPSMAPSSPWPVRTVTHGRWPAGDVAPRLCPWWDWSFPGKQIPRSPMSPVAPKSPMAGNWLSQTTPVNSTGSRGCGPWVLASERALPTLVPAEGRLVRGGTEPHSPQQAPVHLCQGARLGGRSAELLADLWSPSCGPRLMEQQRRPRSSPSSWANAQLLGEEWGSC